MNYSQSSTNKLNGGFIYFLMIFAYLFITLIGQAILLACGLSEGNFWTAVNSTFSAIAILLVVIYLKTFSGVRYAHICSVSKFNPIYILFALLLAVGMFLGLGFLNYAVGGVFSSWGLNVATAFINVSSAGEFILFSICLCVLPAIFEELFFRGALLGSLKGKGYQAVLIIAFCFAIYHGTFVQFFYQFIYGAMLTLLAIKVKSVVPGIVCHFINNFLVVLFMYIDFTVNFLNPLLIALGIALLLAFVLLLIFYRKKENPFTTTLNGETTSKAFFLPFGLVGVLLMTILAVLVLIP